MPGPLLGVAGAWGSREIELYRRFDELHQLIYRRGGLGSTNAAVDELAKLLLVRLRADPTITDLRKGFAAALRDPAFATRDPSGGRHPLWPRDEPFRLADPRVLRAVDALAAQILAGDAGSDGLGTAFDALLAGRYDHTGGLGTYLTPSGVARMMADIAIPLVRTTEPGPGQAHGRPGGRLSPGFGDPYCGTGRFLVALLAALPADHPLRAAGPFGADVSASAVAKAGLNLMLYGVEHPLVWTVGDSVTDAGIDALTGRVPLILTNPPFGEGQYDSPEGIAAAAAVMPSLSGRSRIDPSLACLARAVSLLAPGGVLGIVLPDGVVGSAPVRELLATVEPLAAVSLPPATFALSGTVARTTALFVRRHSRARRGVVTGSRTTVVARVRHVGYVVRAGLPVPDPEGDELATVATLVGTAAASPERVEGMVSESPLVVVGPMADAASLDPAAVAASRALAGAGGVRLSEYLTAVAPRRCRTVSTPFVSVLHVDDLGCVDWHAAGTHAPLTPGVLAEPGELIVSLLNPAILRAAVIPPGPAVQISAEFGVFRSTVDPYAVLALLHTPASRAQLAPLGRGTSHSRRRIGADDVLAVTVPKLDLSTQDQLATAVRAAQHQVTAGRDRLRAAYGDDVLR